MLLNATLKGHESHYFIFTQEINDDAVMSRLGRTMLATLFQSSCFLSVRVNQRKLLNYCDPFDFDYVVS